MVKQAVLEQGAFEHGMFADSMLDFSRSQGSRRGWTTLTSFGLQGTALGLLLLLPLLRTVGVPMARVISTPISAGRSDIQPLVPVPHGAHFAAPAANPSAIRFMQPGHIPIGITNRGEDSAASAPSAPACTGCVEGPGTRDGVLDILASGDHPVMPATPAPPPSHVFRTSSMLQGSLIHSVQPLYPPIARSARIQGSVVLAAVIGKDGAITGLRVLSGHPLLVKAAVEAVSQWRYRPYVLNSEAIEVDTQITVNFTLAN